MNNQGQLLTCPLCALTSKPQVLGRLLTNGQLLILRFHSGTTIVQSANITLQCTCGFAYYLVGNHVEGTAMLNI